MAEVSIAVESFESADAQRLIGELDGGLGAMYTPDQRFGPRFNRQPDPSVGTFLIARVDGAAVGCGALKLVDAERAEVKRMYVIPEHRGQGIAQAILARLADYARGIGASRLVLETGIHQAEAIRLYERWGFAKVDCWGEYVSSATSVCYDKALN